MLGKQCIGPTFCFCEGRHGAQAGRYTSLVMSCYDFAAEEFAYAVSREFAFEQSQLELVVRKLQAGRSVRLSSAPVEAPPAGRATPGTRRR